MYKRSMIMAAKSVTCRQDRTPLGPEPFGFSSSLAKPPSLNAIASNYTLRKGINLRLHAIGTPASARHNMFRAFDDDVLAQCSLKNLELVGT